MEIILALSLITVIGIVIALLVRHIKKLEMELVQKNNAEVLLRKSCEEAQSARFEVEKQLEITNERYAQIEKRMADWQKSRDEAMQHAKAAIFEAGSQLSGKLLEEHKRETQEAKKESEEAVRQTAGQLHMQVQQLEHHVASLKGKLDESSDTVELVKRSLLSPVGAGSLAEITLENILKGSGLVKGRDFIMQYTIADNGEGNRLRPDAVLFLPAGRVIVVDSKASKFFLELAQAEGEKQEQEIYGKIKVTMRNHLKSLASKDYKEAVRLQLRKLDAGREVRHISVIMFMPSESALEKIFVADAEFHMKALEAEILPAGPAGIVNIVSMSRFHIAEEQQLKNHERILEEVQKLLANLNVMYDHAQRLGKAIHSSAAQYDKFSASFNSKMLHRAKTIQHLGISLPNNKPLPVSLERYQMIARNGDAVMEGEVDEIAAATGLLESS